MKRVEFGFFFFETGNPPPDYPYEVSAVDAAVLARKLGSGRVREDAEDAAAGSSDDVNSVD
jgi:hypothetical protein